MLCFNEAQYLFRSLPKGINSLVLRPNVRLVELSPDLYGVQLYNTYVVRISQAGVYLLNTNGRPTDEVLQVFNTYTPARLERIGSQFYYTETKRLFADRDAVDLVGNVIEPLTLRYRQTKAFSTKV